MMAKKRFALSSMGKPLLQPQLRKNIAYLMLSQIRLLPEEMGRLETLLKFVRRLNLMKWGLWGIWLISIRPMNYEMILI